MGADTLGHESQRHPVHQRVACLEVPKHCDVMQRQRGVALLAVLWIVAALSVMVTSMATSVLGEIRDAGTSKSAVLAHGQALAAINLTLRRVKSDPRATSVLRTQDERLIDGARVTVSLTPLSGLIDLNQAAPSLLEALFQVAGQRDSSSAAQLAQAVVQRRTAKDVQERIDRIDSASELLGLPGMDYSTYAKTVKFVTTDARSDGRVNISSASDELLLVLAGGNRDLAQQLRSAALKPPGEPPPPGINPAWVGGTATTRFMVVAVVALGDARRFKLTQVVDLAAKDELPWQTFRSEQQIETTSP